MYAHLPAWYFVYQSVSLAYAEVKVYVPPVSKYLWTAVFPFAWFLAYRLPFAFHSKSGRWRKTLSIVVVPILLFVCAVTVARPYPLEGRDLLRYTEIWSLGVYAVAVLHCMIRYGRRMFVHIFVIGFVYGMVLENSGIVTGFFSEQGYRLYIPGVPAPLFTMAGWCTAVYVCVHATEGIWRTRALTKASIALKAFVATAAAISIDMQVDPAATYSGWWVWNKGLGSEIMGVPSVNFVAWFAALFPFFCAYFWYVSDVDRAAHVRLRPMILSLGIGLAGAATLILVLIAVLLGFDSTSWHLLTQAIANPIDTIWGR